MSRALAAAAVLLAAAATAGCAPDPIRPPAGGVRSVAPAASASPSPSASAVAPTPATPLSPAAAAHQVFIDLVAASCGPGQGEDDAAVVPPGDQAGLEQLPTANRWKVTDAEGRFLLMDVQARVVTGATASGLAAELPEPYALACDPDVFVPADA